MKTEMCPYWYTVKKILPYGSRLDVWKSNPVTHYSERVGGATIALQDKVEVKKRLSLAIERYKQKFPGLLSEKEVKQ